MPARCLAPAARFANALFRGRCWLHRWTCPVSGERWTARTGHAEGIVIGPRAQVTANGQRRSFPMLRTTRFASSIASNNRLGARAKGHSNFGIIPPTPGWSVAQL